MLYENILSCDWTRNQIINIHSMAFAEGTPELSNLILAGNVVKLYFFNPCILGQIVLYTGWLKKVLNMKRKKIICAHHIFKYVKFISGVGLETPTGARIRNIRKSKIWGGGICASREKYGDDHFFCVKPFLKTKFFYI